jgi:hypothetical protein
MSTLKDWTGIDFNPYKRIFNYISEIWDWYKIYHQMKKGEFKVENAMKLADKYTKRHNKKYYVIPFPDGSYKPINEFQFEAHKRGKYSLFQHNATVVDLLKKSVYQTFPKNASDSFFKKEVLSAIQFALDNKDNKRVDWVNKNETIFLFEQWRKINNR